jgi:hypothetical protein
MVTAGQVATKEDKRNGSGGGVFVPAVGDVGVEGEGDAAASSHREALHLPLASMVSVSKFLLQAGRRRRRRRNPMPLVVFQRLTGRVPRMPLSKGKN